MPREESVRCIGAQRHRPGRAACLAADSQCDRARPNLEDFEIIAGAMRAFENAIIAEAERDGGG